MEQRPWPEVPELAAVYDAECAGRWDHDFYLTLVDGLDARTVVDIGCGTGVFCVDVAAAGRAAIGIDPARAVLDIARRRPGGDQVDWIQGTATDGPTGRADLVIMMGHVAQYFVVDDEWAATLAEVHRMLVPGGRVAFEVRNPALDWARNWTREHTEGTLDHPDGGTFDSWVEVVDVVGPPESYRMTHEGHTVLPDGRHLSARETLRFRSRDQVEASLVSNGFTVEQLWGDWDRSPVRAGSPEFIFVAARTDT